MTTKILALTDALGNLVRVNLLPGQRCDTIGVAPLLKGVTFDGLIAPSRQIASQSPAGQWTRLLTPIQLSPT